MRECDHICLGPYAIAVSTAYKNLAYRRKTLFVRTLLTGGLSANQGTQLTFGQTVSFFIFTFARKSPQRMLLLLTRARLQFSANVAVRSQGGDFALCSMYEATLVAVHSVSSAPQRPARPELASRLLPSVCGHHRAEPADITRVR